MNKQELMENFTIEQLADMVICKQEEIEEYQGVFVKNKNEISELKSEIDKAECKVAMLGNEIDKWQKENEKLHHDNEEFSAFCGQFPGEPIQIAEWLISIHMDEVAGAVHDICESCNGVMPEGMLEKIRRNAVSNLRQVAEHLMVYCKSSRGCDYGF